MSTNHDIALVPVSGELCARTAPTLEHTLDNLLGVECHRIILNMAGVPHIDASGMAVLIGTIRRMQSYGGFLSLVNVSPDVLHALKIARIVDVIPVSVAGVCKEVPELDPSVLPLWRTTLPVDACDMGAARCRVAELAKRLGFAPDAAFDLTLAVGEALGNAADHTCGTGILATVSGYPDRMVVEVTDCGEGIGVQCSAECADDAERGRGIKLMQLLVDSVRIETRPSGSGTMVRLVKLV